VEKVLEDFDFDRIAASLGHIRLRLTRAAQSRSLNPAPHRPVLRRRSREFENFY
jgi:hypothetical protein